MRVRLSLKLVSVAVPGVTKFWNGLTRTLIVSAVRCVSVALGRAHGLLNPRGYFWGVPGWFSGAALVGASAGGGAFSAAHLANSSGVSISTSARMR